MHSRTLITGIALTMAGWTATWTYAADDLDAALARIDKAGAAFHSLSVHVKRVSHTAVINEDNTDSGAMLLKRSHRDMRMRVDFTEPDAKTVVFQGQKVEIYYPKINTVQEFDLGQNKELVDEFLLIGFGTSSAELKAAYQVKLVGSDTVGGQKTARLELIPKSKDVLKHLRKLELWVAETGYPVQQKFYEPAGDYMVFTYSDTKINADVPEAALKLHMPKGVKHEYPQK